MSRHNPLKKAEERWLGEIEEIDVLAQCGQLESYIQGIATQEKVFLVEREACHMLMDAQKPYLAARTYRLLARHHLEDINKPSPYQGLPVDRHHTERGWLDHLTEVVGEALSSWIPLWVTRSPPGSLEAEDLEPELREKFEDDTLEWRLYENPHILGGLLHLFGSLEQELASHRSSASNIPDAPPFLPAAASLFPSVRRHQLVRPWLLRPDASRMGWKNILKDATPTELAQLVGHMLPQLDSSSIHRLNSLAQVLEQATPEQLQGLSSEQLSALCQVQHPALRQAALRASGHLKNRSPTSRPNQR